MKAAVLTVVPVWVNHLADALDRSGWGDLFEERHRLGFAIALHEVLASHELKPQFGRSPDGRPAVLIGAVAIDHRGCQSLGSASDHEMVASVKAILSSGQDACKTSALRGDVDLALQVIALARRLAQEASPWPMHLAGPGAIAEHVVTTASDGEDEVDEEFVEHYFEGSQAVLVRIPTAEFVINKGKSSGNVRSSKKETAYRKLPAETVPPTVVNEMGGIEDGHHRLRVALRRGDLWMLSYMTLDENLDLTLPDQELSSKRRKTARRP